MWEVDATVIGGWVGNLLWPFFRIGAFFMVVPVIGTRLVPARIRVLLAVMMTAILVPNLPPMPVADGVSLEAMVIAAQQVLIGVGMGFVLQALLQMFVITGQMIAMKMGLGFASMVDPSNGISVTVVSQFHLMLVTLLFLVMNGHLAMIEVLAHSFVTLPVGQGSFNGDALMTLAGWGGWMFSGALLMALPAVTALLIVNCALGVITRAAPQLNIFAIGFPFMLVLGLIIIWITVGGYLPHFDRFSAEALMAMEGLVQG